MKITPKLLSQIYAVISATENSKENFIHGIFRSYYPDGGSKATLYRIYSTGPKIALVASYAQRGCTACLELLEKDILDWMDNRFTASELYALNAMLFGFMTQISLEDYDTVVGNLVDADYSRTRPTAALMSRILWYAMCRDCAQASLDGVA